MRGAQPALRDWRVRVVASLEDHFGAVRGEGAQHEKYVGVGRRGLEVELGRQGPGNLDLARSNVS